MSGKVNYTTLINEQGTAYIGDKNDNGVSSANYHYNSYFNIDISQAAYFTVAIDGFEYSRFFASLSSDVSNFSSDEDKWNNGFRNLSFENYASNGSQYWLPVKSLTYSQGSMDTMSFACGVFADLQLPFRKKLPSLKLEVFDSRSDFFEMKFREWHARSVVSGGYVPVLESITKNVHIRSFATNGLVNAHQICKCILAGDISTSRSYETNGFKTISVELIIVGY